MWKLGTWTNNQVLERRPREFKMASEEIDPLKTSPFWGWRARSDVSRTSYRAKQELETLETRGKRSARDASSFGSPPSCQDAMHTLRASLRVRMLLEDGSRICLCVPDLPAHVGRTVTIPVDFTVQYRCVCEPGVSKLLNYPNNPKSICKPRK
jgi:hypothetical protein